MTSPESERRTRSWSGCMTSLEPLLLEEEEEEEAAADDGGGRDDGRDDIEDGSPPRPVPVANATISLPSVSCV